MSTPIMDMNASKMSKRRTYAIDNGLPELIYEDFATYAMCMVPTWGTDELNWEWFHNSISNLYRDIAKGELDVLTLETHSQLGKSVLTALFITWVFGINPNYHVMYFTYNEDAAIRFTKNYVLSFISSEKYRKIFPFVGLKNDLPKDDFSKNMYIAKKLSTFKDNLFNVVNPFVEINKQYRGDYIALGLGQGSHGKPGDLIIVDDYVDKAENIKSPVYRAKLKRFIETDAIARYQASTKLVVICTRWFRDDPIGIVQNKVMTVNQGRKKLELDPIKYKFVKIRAEYRVNDNNLPEDPRTTEGEFLWKAMITKYLMAKDSEFYQAMYNCDPQDGTIMINISRDSIHYYNELPEGGLIYLSSDTASTTNVKSDFTVIHKYKLVNNKRYLMKIWKLKKNIPDLERFYIDLLTTSEYGYYQNLVEYANSGVAICQKLKELHIPVTPLTFAANIVQNFNDVPKQPKERTVNKSTSKMDKYLLSVAEFTSGRVLVPAKPIEHQEEFIEQITTFTDDDSKHDDHVSATCQLIVFTLNKNSSGVEFGDYSQNDDENNLTNSNQMCYSLGDNANYFLG